MTQFINLLFFPGGLFLLGLGLSYEWLDRKLLARLQNRIGPRWFQPLADTIKLLSKEEIVPQGVNPWLFIILPVVALAGTLTAALYVPILGLTPAYSLPGDLIITLYLLSLLTLCTGLAGANTQDRFSLVGAIRTLTQLFAYEAPFLIALLGPAIGVGSWQISVINDFAHSQWFIVTQFVAPAVAGLFYPDDARVLRVQLSGLMAAAPPPDLALPPKALIVPHAGYIYSGPIAASAYRLLAPLRGEITRVILIGPTHRMAVRGIALPAAQSFATPLGGVPVSRID